MLPLLRSAVLLLLAAPLAAQGHVLVVQASGGGAPYTTIPAALSAAQPGDVLLVKSGTYSGFAVANKAVSIVGDVSANVLVQGTIQVRNLAADRHVLLANLHAIGATSPSANDGPGITLKDDLGAVRVQGCIAQGAANLPGLRAAGSVNAAASDCTLVGGVGAASAVFVPSGSGLELDASSFVLLESSAIGGNGYFAGTPNLGYPACGGGTGGSAVRVLTTTFLHVAGSALTGGLGRDGTDGCNGGGQLDQCCFGGGGGHGYRLDSSGSTLWRLDDLVQPGSEGLGGTGHCGCGLVTTCDCWADEPGQSVFAGQNDSLSTLPGAAPRLSALLNPVREGQSVQLAIDASPGDQIFLLVDRRPAFAPQPGAGVRLVDPSAPHLMQIVGPADPLGNASLSWVVPDLGAGVESVVVHLQAFVVQANGARRWSNPLALVLLDSAF